jgi:hypothetical protein
MPNTIEQNLQLLIQAKSNIATAITNKGGIVNHEDGFSSFSDDIATIPIGNTLVTLTMTGNGGVAYQFGRVVVYCVNVSLMVNPGSTLATLSGLSISNTSIYASNFACNTDYRGNMATVTYTVTSSSIEIVTSKYTVGSGRAVGWIIFNP